MATTTLPASRQPLAATAGIAWTVALFWTFYGAHDWTEIAIGVAAITLATGLVFGLVAPRALRRQSAPGWSLGLGVVAVLATLPAFSSGIPLILGAGAAVLGNNSRTAERRSGMAITGLVLGVIAVLGYLAIYIGDGVILGNSGFLLD
jgi:ABC-type sulfate transport system permease component